MIFQTDLVGKVMSIMILASPGGIVSIFIRYRFDYLILVKAVANILQPA